MKNMQFNDEWKEWIRTNVARGCSKDELFKVLIDEGFAYGDIKAELDHEPSAPVETIENRLLQDQQSRIGPSDVQSQTTAKKIYLPHAQRVDTNRAEIYVVDDFLNQDECRQLVSIIKSKLRPSTITNPDEPDKYFRTSQTCDLIAANDPFVHMINERICNYLGINPTHSEPIQGQHYETGQEFKAHTDYFEAGEFEKFAGSKGQRTWTFMIYLNDTERGGETHFVELDRSFAPRAGRALVWNNLHPDGRLNPDTMHHGMPVEAGEKTIITKWFREKGTGAPFIKEANEYIPACTSTGFDQRRVPSALYEKLHDFYLSHAEEAQEEVVEGYIAGPDSSSGSELIELPAALKADVHKLLQPLLEQWSGAELEPTVVYGIRRYTRGATLKPHRDRVRTHIISAILNIDQSVDEDWPLEIDDHYYRTHRLNLAPGDMLFYEGGRLRHGRPDPLQGDAYANVFVHHRRRGKRAELVKIDNT